MIAGLGAANYTGGIILQNLQKNTLRLKLPAQARDILTRGMNRRRLRALYPVLVFTAVGLLTVLSSLSGSALQSSPTMAPASKLGPVTATPIPSAGSVPGSTDGIIWLGVVIALVIVLPLIFTKSFWTKS